MELNINTLKGKSMKQSKLVTPAKIAAITLSAVLLFGCDEDSSTSDTTSSDTTSSDTTSSDTTSSDTTSSDTTSSDTNSSDTTTSDTTSTTESSFPDTIDEFKFSSATSPFANSGDTGETELRQNGSQTITATTNYDGVANTAIHHDQGTTNTTTSVGNLKYSADSANIDAGSLTGSFSIEAVIKVSDRVMTNDSDIVAFFGDKTGTYGGFKVYLESSSPNINQIKFKLYGTDSSDSSVNKNTEVKAATVLTVDVWQHVMAVYNADTDTASIYLDGVLSASSVLSDKGVVLVKNPTADDDFTVLGGASSSDKNFDGDVDNVATWNVALTADQVSERAEEFGF